MNHRQKPQTPETAVSGPQDAERGTDDAPDAGTRDRPPSAHTEPPAIRQLRAERDLLARTVAVYTMRSTADVLAETREALGWTDNRSTHRPQAGDPSTAGHSAADPSGGGAL
ncbi:hypothetical protein OIU91_06240 [Streptomyces sp. NBC_01456]|uniref:hypothetical protein n=1 Tax=unclassified Streptomyces TaxID=2593676 RepID=UPI002E34CA4D|nr:MULTISPECIES: hypothetical protein [unclassified Streptomyces]